MAAYILNMPFIISMKCLAFKYSLLHCLLLISFVFRKKSWICICRYAYIYTCHKKHILYKGSLSSNVEACALASIKAIYNVTNKNKNKCKHTSIHLFYFVFLIIYFLQVLGTKHEHERQQGGVWSCGLNELFLWSHVIEVCIC